MSSAAVCDREAVGYAARGVDVERLERPHRFAAFVLVARLRRGDDRDLREGEVAEEATDDEVGQRPVGGEVPAGTEFEMAPPVCSRRIAVGITAVSRGRGGSQRSLAQRRRRRCRARRAGGARDRRGPSAFSSTASSWSASSCCLRPVALGVRSSGGPLSSRQRLRAASGWRASRGCANVACIRTTAGLATGRVRAGSSGSNSRS